MNRTIPSLLLLAGLLPAAPRTCAADVTLESRLTVESIGGSGSGDVTMELSGLKRREERRLAFTGAFAPGGADTSETTITRLDRAVLTRLDAADSTFEDIPLAQVGAKLRQGGADVMPGMDPSSVDLRWTVETASPGGTATIAGFTATPTVITLRGKGTSRTSGEPIELALVSELWSARGVPGAAELRAFDARYATAVGMDPGAIEATLGSFGLPKSALRLLSAARAKVAGTPLRTVLKLEMPGLSDLLAKMSAALPGGGSAAPAPSGPLLTTTIEVTKVSAGKVGADRFLVPPGYRKKAKLAPADG
jgi:hypothetical protein